MLGLKALPSLAGSENLNETRMRAVVHLSEVGLGSSISVTDENVDLKIVPTALLLAWDEFMCWWR